MSVIETELQVVIASGPTELQRATFGLAAALAAVSSGTDVHVVFTMHGAHWASPHAGDSGGVPEFPTIAQLIEDIQEAGGTVQACSTCVDNYCPSIEGNDGRKQLRKGIERVGLGLVAIRMAEMRTIMC